MSLIRDLIREEIRELVREQVRAELKAELAGTPEPTAVRATMLPDRPATSGRRHPAPYSQRWPKRITVRLNPDYRGAPFAPHSKIERVWNTVKEFLRDGGQTSREQLNKDLATLTGFDKFDLSGIITRLLDLHALIAVNPPGGQS